MEAIIIKNISGHSFRIGERITFEYDCEGVVKATNKWCNQFILIEEIYEESK